jgi:hypothetical protein
VQRGAREAEEEVKDEQEIGFDEEDGGLLATERPAARGLETGEVVYGRVMVEETGEVMEAAHCSQQTQAVAETVYAMLKVEGPGSARARAALLHCDLVEGAVLVLKKTIL